MLLNRGLTTNGRLARTEHVRLTIAKTTRRARETINRRPRPARDTRVFLRRADRRVRRADERPPDRKTSAIILYSVCIILYTHATGD